MGTYKLRDNFLLKVFRVERRAVRPGDRARCVPDLPVCARRVSPRIGGITISFHARCRRARSTDSCCTRTAIGRAAKLSPSELPPEPKEIKLDAAALGDYLGRYQFNFRHPRRRAQERRALEAQLTGQPAFPIFASARGQVLLQDRRRAARASSAMPSAAWRRGGPAPERPRHAGAACRYAAVTARSLKTSGNPELA